ncbi:hypothetical protein SpCBS45565_g01848 [Spizellomyces sp. 'palustris']|nr:hypothetical protein SpCBS45565_g01848 [Spizellomyces sp. 'palustris']
MTPPIPLNPQCPPAHTFLTPSQTLSTSLLKTTCALYTLAHQSQPRQMTHLDKVWVDGFDAEQIWEQIWMLVGPFGGYFEDKVQEVLGNVERDAVEGDLHVDELEEEEEDMSEQDEDDDEDVKDDKDEEVEESEEEDEELEHDNEDILSGSDPLDTDDQHSNASNPPDSPRKRKSIIDDDFFSLADMERFADFGEARDMKRARRNQEDVEDDDDDEFALEDELNEEDENANEIQYEDFFGPREQHHERPDARVRFSDQNQVNEFQREDENQEDGDQEDDDQEDGDQAPGNPAVHPSRTANLFEEDTQTDTTTLSSFEREQKGLAAQISQLESEAIAPKPWTLKGEAFSKSRPVNSLLEEDLEYEHAAKPVPVITEEKTSSLEDLIKQRIKDAVFDDVVRKAPPRDRDFDPNRRIEIIEEKSSKGLAEVYEEDYMRNTGQTTTTEKDAALAAQHAEIDTLFKSLCQNLDALSNWHFQPKPTTVELQVTPLPNAPALQMEDITPSHVADSALVAPSEVFAPPKDLKGDKELSSGTKKRLRDKTRKQAGKARKEKQDRRQSVVAAKPRTALAERKEKESALKKLMGQKNVTVVGKVDKGAKARGVEKGGKIGERKVERAEFLRL